MNNLVCDVKANPRYTISQKKVTQGIPTRKGRMERVLLSRTSKKAKEFNGQFTDVLNKNGHTQVPLLDRSAPFMDDNVVFKDGVIKLLKRLEPF